jgi:hypothetical protein
VVALKGGSLMEREVRARVVEKTDRSETGCHPGAAYFAYLDSFDKHGYGKLSITVPLLHKPLILRLR